MKYNINIINQYIDEGWISKTNHPTLPIAVYNYTRKTQFDRHWDDITISCRCLVLDNDGNLIAKSFDKFFNLEELGNINFPNEPFEVYEKLDGSIILAFRYDNTWIITSKSSFTSLHAIEASNLFYKLEYDKLFSDLINVSIVFEYISDWNRIVVRYDRTRLVLLSMYSIDLNKEIPLSAIQAIYSENIDYPKRYNPDSFTSLKNKISDNEEGFVIRFDSGFRFKIKGEEYVKLHKMLTNINNIDIWESLKNNYDINKLINDLPDEFDIWAKSIIDDLLSQKAEIENTAINLFKTFKFVRDIDGTVLITKKDFALWVNSLDYEHKSILFSLFDNKNYESILWAIIKPKFEKPFWRKETDDLDIY